MTDQTNQSQPDQSSNQQPAVQTAVEPVSIVWYKPLTWFTARASKNRTATAHTSAAALATVPTNQQLAEQLQQVALTADTPLETIVAMLTGQSHDVEEVIDSLDEDKEHPIGKAVGMVATVICYVLPWIIAFYAGSALGSTYAHKAFNPLDFQTGFYYLVSWAYEFGLVALMIAIVRQFRRVTGGRGIPAFVALLLLFLVLAVTSASAQWILFESRINAHDTAQLIGALFRTLGTPLTDITCAIVLGVLHVKSLDQQLAVMQKKSDAKIAINRKKMQNNLEVISAAMEVKNTLQKEEDYRNKNELANTIIGLYSENAIAVIQESLQGRNQQNGSSYRRDSMR